MSVHMEFIFILIASLIAILSGIIGYLLVRAVFKKIDELADMISEFREEIREDYQRKEGCRREEHQRAIEDLYKKYDELLRIGRVVPPAQGAE